MNRSLKLSMLLALALGSSQAVALELGQIQVKSALGQPLLAEIPVTPESPADLRNLSARLASNEDFARAGITDGRTAVPLNFAIVNGPGGSKLIRITSNDAINDPYLDLLVQVDNAAGKSVREYTILLDPPGMTAAPPPVAVAPSRAPAPTRAAPAPAPRANLPAPAAAPAPSAAVVDGKFGPVQSGQNLSSIAQQLMPAGADLNQTLLALKQANPQAFYRDNINALKSGAVLRVPTSEEARAMSTAAAIAEVRRQNGDWRSGTVSAPTAVADSATRAGTSTSPSAAPASRDDHLALVPSGDSAKGAAAGSGKNDAEVRLQRSQESLAAMQQQGAELKSRLKDLEDINSKNQRLLALKDNEIAELQQKLAQARQGSSTDAAAASAAPAGAATVATAPVATSATTAATAGAAAAAMPAKAGTASAVATPAITPAATSPVSSKPTAVKSAPVKKAAPAKRAATPATADEPWYMQTWAWAAGAIAVVLLLLLGLRGRRGKAPGKPSGSSLADRFGAAPLPVDGAEDPDQDELLDQLAEHPDDIGLHLELVSLYYHRRDVEHFEAAAEAMYAHISDPQQSEWQDVAAMGEDLVPGHPLFVGVDTSVPENERQSLPGFDLDAYASSEDVAPTPAPPPMPASAPAKVSEYHFDFNLTPQRDMARAPLAEVEREHEPDAGDDMDFALDSADASLADTAEPGDAMPAWQADADYEPTDFSDDPIDTKLDLARAYLDMGDADGARAMLEEVLAEGSQPQRDIARRLLDGIA